MAASAVPVARDGLGVEGDLDVVQLGQPQQDVARHPQLITHVNAHAWAHLPARIHPRPCKHTPLGTTRVELTCLACTALAASNCLVLSLSAELEAHH